MPGLGAYVVVGGVAAVATFLLTPLVRALLAVRRSRRRRTSGGCTSDPTPTLGGVAMLVGFLAGDGRGVAARRLRPGVRVVAPSRSASCSAPSSSSPSACSTTSRHECVGPGQGSPGMVLAGSVLSLARRQHVLLPHPVLRASSCCHPTSRLSSPCCGSSGMANAINFIDGLDGLAAGIVAIAAGAFFLYGAALDDAGACSPRQRSAPLVAVIVLGDLPRLPALQLPPGAHLHGRLRRAAARPADGGVDDRRRRPTDTSRSAARRTSSSPRCSSRSFILGVPILDTAFAIVRRATRRASASRPPTRTTCTTGSCASATASAAAS